MVAASGTVAVLALANAGAAAAFTSPENAPTNTSGCQALMVTSPGVKVALALDLNTPGYANTTTLLAATCGGA